VRADKRTVKMIGINQLADDIRNGKYIKKVSELRAIYPYLSLDRRGNPELKSREVAKNIPELCFSEIIRQENNVETFGGYTGRVLLEVKNLRDYDTARRIRQTAAQMPQTMMTFMGADGRSVEIICNIQSLNGELPQTEDEAYSFQLKAYKKALMAYTAQMGINIDNLKPKLNRTCLMSVDKEIVFRNDAVPFYIDTEEKVKLPEALKPLAMDEQKERERLMPGYDQNQTNRYVYQCCLTKALEESRLESKENLVPKVLTLLSRYCRECGLPLEMCICQTLYNSDIGTDGEYVRKVFNNAYLKKILNTIPLKSVPQSALMTFKTEAMLKEMFDMRRNIITGEVQFRRRNGFNYDFRALNDIEKKDITVRALKDGLDTWDKDMTRLLGSSLPSEYDPIEDYLRRLPEWDKNDRITEMAKRIPTDNPEWPMFFRVWMMSMVAQWQGKNDMQGNAIIPLLIGYQGSGKSSFCKTILPPDLMAYFNDKLNFENDNAVMRALSQFALINIDEFDSLKKSQQPMLKYLVQKNDVKLRKMYGQNIEYRRRYASFIGTTNKSTPLTDETGSRRFICTKVTAPIDYAIPINYEQLYAQIVEEVSNGCRYWFNDEENKRIQEWNMRFTQLENMAIMLDSVLTKPKNEKEGKLMYLSDIVDMMAERYRNFDFNNGALVKIGRYLSQQDFECVRKKAGMAYKVKLN
jgi:hypothetical protein